MVDFQLSPKQAQLREFAHQFAEHIIRPMSLEADRRHGWPDDFLLLSLIHI